MWTDIHIGDAKVVSKPGALNVTEWLEFHDSTLTGVVVRATHLELLLDGYIHRWERLHEEWRGTGWMQNVRIAVSDALAPAVVPRLPVDIGDGWLQVGTGPRDGLARFPLQVSGDIRIWLQATTADVVELTGTAVCIEAIGEARYVEQLPGDLRPQDPG
jgi:hypothetical protein